MNCPEMLVIPWFGVNMHRQCTLSEGHAEKHVPWMSIGDGIEFFERLPEGWELTSAQQEQLAAWVSKDKPKLLKDGWVPDQKLPYTVTA